LGLLFAELGNMTDAEQGIEAIYRLSAEGYATGKLIAMRNGARFTQSLAGFAARPVGPGCETGTCGWVSHQLTGYRSNLGETYEGHQRITSMGAQWQSQQGWRIGLAMGTEGGGWRDNKRFSGSYEGERLGVFGWMPHGEWEFQGGLSFGKSRMDAARHVGFAGILPDETEVALDRATSRIGMRQINLNLGVASNHLNWDNGTYLRPLAEVDLAWTRAAGVEDGLGAAGLRMDEGYRFNSAIRVSAEYGYRVDEPNGGQHLSYLRAGVSHNLQGSMAAGMRLIGAPDSAAAFDQFAPMPRTMLDLSAGVKAFDPGTGVYSEIQLDGHFWKKTQEITGSIKFGIKF
ncbi:MAG: autotransporter outer membrane beta-barrel domain-containing protein, partial [Paracoccus sp. (in: a-proteobacteria)]|nr:autotransporter outer membrane beta-barrel domain-containing protein [Paracoccus sp. (in: a-proteobacteria)]